MNLTCHFKLFKVWRESIILEYSFDISYIHWKICFKKSNIKNKSTCSPGPSDLVPVKTAGIAGIDARPGKLQNFCRPGPGFIVPVETRLTFTNAVQFISTTEKIKIDKKYENNEKIKKDSIGITKANEKIIKSKQEKIKKDSIGITKTYEKNTKSKKCFEKSKIKNKSMIKISRKVIQKKLKNKKI